MPIFDIDLSRVSVGVGEGTHIATVQKVEYQLKTGALWNNEGTTNITKEEFNLADPDKARMHITLGVSGKGNHWHDLYFSGKSLGFVKAFYAALGCKLTDSIEGKSIGFNAVMKEDPTYGPRLVIAKFFKA